MTQIHEFIPPFNVEAQRAKNARKVEANSITSDGTFTIADGAEQEIEIVVGLGHCRMPVKLWGLYFDSVATGLKVKVVTKGHGYPTAYKPLAAFAPDGWFELDCPWISEGQMTTKVKIKNDTGGEVTINVAEVVYESLTPGR